MLGQLSKTPNYTWSSAPCKQASRRIDKQVVLARLAALRRNIFAARHFPHGPAGRIGAHRIACPISDGYIHSPSSFFTVTRQGPRETTTGWGSSEGEG